MAPSPPTTRSTHRDSPNMRPLYSDEIEEIRRREYPALHDVTYLDHAGTTLYADSLIRQFTDDLTSNLFGNPHSASPSSDLSTRRVEGVRSRLLNFFQADPEHFDLVFVANATAAIKVVADAFSNIGPPGFWYGYHRDAHTSIVGMRQLAARSRCFESDQDVEDWLQADVGQDGASLPRGIGLFAYPAQSNMNGHRLPLDWAAKVRRSARARHKDIYVLVDAAAYAMTAQLDLSDVESAPDFTALSFYKIFGFPDLGALIVRKTAVEVLKRRRFFGGGTVDMITVLKDEWVARKEGTIHEQLEDGTLPFHHIIALDAALDVHARVYGSMTNISRHTSSLAAGLYDRLASLRHANGRPVCEIYKDPTSRYGDAKTQGPTVAFNVRNAQGGWVGKTDVERLAIVRNIHLRTGGVCNPGGIATFCRLAYWELRRNFAEGMRCGDDLDVLGGKPTGVVRVSVGPMSNQRDVDTFVTFLEDLFVETEATAIPASLTAPPPAIKADATVGSLRVFPVMGCPGWDVPQGVDWPIGETGLCWDEEWCIVRQGDNRPLDPLVHRRMMTIKPSLEPEEGVLRLLAPSTSSPTDAGYDELTVSLWETPPVTKPAVPNATHRRADPYPSEAISRFFTRVLGIPSTLARFEHYRKAAQTHPSHQPGRTTAPTRSARAYQSSLTIASHVEESASSNISLSKRRGRSSSGQSTHFIRIGQQYFQVFKSTNTTNPSAASPIIGTTTKLIHLRNLYDRSAAAQDPTVRVGDPVQHISTEKGIRDVALRACMMSLAVGEHICPVWNCRRDFVGAEDLAEHLQVHKTRRPRVVVVETSLMTKSTRGLTKSTRDLTRAAGNSIKATGNLGHEGEVDPRYQREEADYSNASKETQQRQQQRSIIDSFLLPVALSERKSSAGKDSVTTFTTTTTTIPPTTTTTKKKKKGDAPAHIKVKKDHRRSWNPRAFGSRMRSVLAS